MQMKATGIEQIINPGSVQYEHSFHNPFEIEDLWVIALSLFSHREQFLLFIFVPLEPLVSDMQRILLNYKGNSF